MEDIRVKTIKTEQEKVTNTVGTFLNEEQIFWLKNHQPQLWWNKREYIFTQTSLIYFLSINR
ncbi:hypothetical protein D0T08_03430 [Emticicia sp. C21]|nr:hypothetical protein D0T08_03430 [Emticicia sp. C21]